MTYNPNQINPPEPRLSDVVTCEQCQDDVCRGDAVNVGQNQSPVWLCKYTDCLKHYATDVTAEYESFKCRSHKLVQQVTHGVGPHGDQDFGRWDIAPDGTTGGLVLISKPETGQYRLVQLGGVE